MKYYSVINTGFFHKPLKKGFRHETTNQFLLECQPRVLKVAQLGMSCIFWVWPLPSNSGK